QHEAHQPGQDVADGHPQATENQPDDVQDGSEHGPNSTTGRAGRAHSCGVMTAPRRCAMVLATALRQEHLMESGDYDPPLAPGLLIAQSWQVTVILGAVTLILGLI